MGFQRVIDEVCTLPLSSPSRSKRESALFVNKIQIMSNKVYYKLSLCEIFQRQIVA